MNIVRLCLLFLPILVHPFHIYGSWIHPSHNIRIDVGRKNCKLIRDERTLTIETIDIKHYPNNTIMILMKNPRVLRPPPDWYNVVKYAKHIHYFRRVQKHGMSICIDWIEHDKIIIHTRIQDESIPSLEFIRRHVSLSSTDETT